MDPTDGNVVEPDENGKVEGVMAVRQVGLEPVMPICFVTPATNLSTCYLFCFSWSATNLTLALAW